MKIPAVFILPVLFALNAGAQKQKTYTDSLQAFRTNYIETHEVVKKDDRKYLQFYSIDTALKINCRFEKINDGKWFEMSTSANKKQVYKKYGKLHFTLHDTTLQLFIYQSQSLMGSIDYADYLFIPFTDATNGIETYGGGRYLEYFISDIKKNTLLVDFNKAYNPYCAYTTGYNCPIPPRENDLPVAIQAGEKDYGKKTH